MKAMLRCGYLALIVLGIAIQVTHGQTATINTDPMAALAAGLRRLKIEPGAPTPDGILTGHTPSCGQPITATVLRIDGADDERVRDLRLDDRLLRYVFLGSVYETRNSFGIAGRWIWASALFNLGLRSSRPAPRLVLVVLPRACPEVAALAWTILSPED